jgi:predicted membrane protein (TIGR00267 family)
MDIILVLYTHHVAVMFGVSLNMTETTSAENKAQTSEMEEHMSLRNYMRDVILGANDGLVSVFALVLGVAGGGFAPRAVLLAGIAAAVAGAISMSIGEYLSTKSQEEVYDAERELERDHIEHNLEHEIEELYEFYEAKGFSGEILDTIVKTIASDKDVLLNEMMMAEFGVLEHERRSPIKATVIVGIAFFLGTLPPVIPFFFAATTSAGILVSGIASVIGLFGVGALKGRFTRGHQLRAGIENMVLGLTGALITYVIGYYIGLSI